MTNKIEDVSPHASTQAVREVPCPYCDQPVGKYCTAPSGRKVAAHSARETEYLKKIGKELFIQRHFSMKDSYVARESYVTPPSTKKNNC